MAAKLFYDISNSVEHALMKVTSVTLALAEEGNKEVLLSSGFKQTKTKNDKVPLEKAKIIEMKPGTTSGVLLITLKSCSEARSYLCYLSKVPMPASTDDMKLHVSSSPSFEITGLEKLTEYVCIAAILGVDDEKAYSEPKIGNTI